MRRQPARPEQRPHQVQLGTRQRVVVQVRRVGGAVSRLTVRVQLHVAEPLQHGTRRLVPVDDLQSDGGQEPWRFATVRSVAKNGAAAKRIAVALRDRLYHRVQQGMAWREQVGPRLAFDELAVEADPLVPGRAPALALADGLRARG